MNLIQKKVLVNQHLKLKQKYKKIKGNRQQKIQDKYNLNMPQ